MNSKTSTGRSSSSSSSMRARSITTLVVLMVCSFLIINCLASRPHHHPHHDDSVSTTSSDASAGATSSSDQLLQSLTTAASIDVDATAHTKTDLFEDKCKAEAGTRVEGQGSEEERDDWEMDSDECLMKRSLMAHLDYIYTQNHTKSP